MFENLALAKADILYLISLLVQSLCNMVILGFTSLCILTSAILLLVISDFFNEREQRKLRLLRNEAAVREYKGFRGQLFKYLSKEQIKTLLLEKAEMYFDLKGNPYDDSTPYIFAAVTNLSKTSENQKLYVRCQLESFGKFNQIFYEWSGESEATNNARSEENLFVQQLVDKIEIAIGNADLRSSQKDYKLGGSRNFKATRFSPAKVRYVLSNAIEASNDNGETITFRTSIDVRKNPWLDVVEAYIVAANRKEFQLRFYSIDRSVDGIASWDLHCDWKGTLDAMLDSHSQEWQLVHALFAAVKNQFLADGAVPCFPSSEYGHTLNVGVFRAWDYKAIENGYFNGIDFNDICRAFLPRGFSLVHNQSPRLLERRFVGGSTRSWTHSFKLTLTTLSVPPVSKSELIISSCSKAPGTFFGGPFTIMGSGLS